MTDDNIMLIGLTTGEVIVSEGVGSGNSIQLSNPVALVQVPDEAANRMRHAFVPYAPAAERGEIVLSPTAIAYVGVPKQAIIDQYKTMTTGIIRPTSSLITAGV